jgi:hypothetical protein
VNLQNRHAPCTHRPFRRQPGTRPNRQLRPPGPGHPGPAGRRSFPCMNACRGWLPILLQCRRPGGRCSGAASGQRPGELAPSARSSNITSAPMVCAALLLPSALVPPAHLTDANAWPGSLICALHDAASVRLHACMHHSVPCRMACKAVFSGSAWPAPSGARCRCMHKHLGMREYKRWRRCVCDPVHGRPCLGVGRDGGIV